MESPRAYAKQLATYIASPTKIESLTLMEFGEAPPLHIIARMRLAVEQASKPKSILCKDSDVSDGEDYRPRSLVAPEKPAYVKKAPQTPAPKRLRPKLGLVTPGMKAREIIEAVAEAFEMTPAYMTGRSRTTECILARSVVIKLLRERTWNNGEPRYSTTRIGSFLGRDHSTICYALDTFERRLRDYPEAYAVYLGLKDMGA